MLKENLILELKKKDALNKCVGVARFETGQYLKENHILWINYIL